MRVHRTAIILVVGGVALVAGILSWLWLTPSNNTISKSSFHKIHLGMTRKTVHGIIGVPPADYRTSPRVPWHGDLPSSKGWENWAGNDAIICVHFDDAGTADQIAARFSPEEEERFVREAVEERFTDKIRRWLCFW